MVARNLFVLAIASLAGLGVQASPCKPTSASSSTIAPVSSTTLSTSAVTTISTTSVSTTASSTTTSASSAPTCGNRVTDPSFEGDSIPFGWNARVASNGEGVGFAHEGTHFIVTQLEGPFSQSMSLSTFVHDLVPGSEYTVSFWYALGQKQEWGTGVCWLDTEADAGTVVKFDIDRSLPTGQYKQVVGTFTPQSESIMLYFGLWCRGGFGVIDMTFDSFSVSKQSCPQ